MKKQFLPFLAVSLLSCMAVVQAAPITTSISGQVDYVDNSSGNLTLAGFGGLAVGDAYSASYTFDDETLPFFNLGVTPYPPGISGDTEGYLVIDDTGGMSFTSGGVTSPGIGIGGNADWSVIRSHNNLMADSPNPWPRFNVIAQDIWTTGERLYTFANPDSFIDLAIGFATTDTTKLSNTDYFMNNSAAGWESTFFSIKWFNADTGQWTVLASGTSAVPGPHPLLVFLTALLGIGLRRR